MKTRNFSPSLFILLPFVLVLAACGGSGGGSSSSSSSSSYSSSSSSSSSGSTISLNGAVIDGYVSGAAVTVYDVTGFGGPAYLAAGVTDGNGSFGLTVNAEGLPDHLALLSKGGTSIDTGLPAPTLALSRSSDAEHFNLTPLTDAVLRRSLRAGAGFSSSEEELAAELNVTVDDLYADPLDASHPAHAELNAGLYRALANGEQSVVPADGDYRLSLVYLDKNNIGVAFGNLAAVTTSNLLSGTLTLLDGAVSGSLDGGDTITGRINGPYVILSVEYSGGDGVTRVAGTLGLLGSFSGNYVDFDGSGASPELSSGVFVASLIPVSGVDTEGLKAAAEHIYNGNRNALFRDLYGDRDLAWGNMSNVVLDADANTVSVDDFSITLNAAAGETGHQTDDIAFQEGVLLTIDLNGQTIPSGLAMMRFQDNDYDYAYFIQALGNRRGIYMAGCGSTSTNCDAADAGKAYAIGESYLARRDALIPGPEAGTAFDITMTAISPYMLGEVRQPAAFFETLEDWQPPAISSGSGASGSSANDGGVKVISASLIGIKDTSGGADTGELDDARDYMLAAEAHSTGALQGDRVVGGTVTSLGINAADWPVPFAGFAAPSSADTQLLELGDAQFDFMLRPMYLIDPATGELLPLEDYLLAYISGTVQVSEDSAVLNYLDSEGETGSVNLTLENRGGIYYLHGPLGEEYIDIMYPAGGTRGVFVSSDAADGNGDIYEIGEAYLTY